VSCDGIPPGNVKIEDVHQVDDIGLSELAAKIPGRGRVGNSFGSQSVEVDLVIAQRFEVLDSRAAGEDVETDVQEVVGFVVRKVSLDSETGASDSVSTRNRTLRSLK
jgi:hypothetical protein